MKNSQSSRSGQILVMMVTIVLMLVQTNLSAQNALEGKTLLAIFAHPDDESTVAPILSRYVREGAKVHLVIATDGRYGTNDHTDHEAGEGLVAMRKKEMKCAASKLGVELIHLDYHDQLRSAEGYDGHMPHIRSLIKEIHSIVEKVKPDVEVVRSKHEHGVGGLPQLGQSRHYKQA